MKVINYNYGNILKFSCVMHGKIRMTAEEWSKARRYLLQAHVIKAIAKPWGSEWSTKIMLEDDMKRRIETKTGFIISIGVYATAKLAEHYGLKLKQANYMIEVVN